MPERIQLKRTKGWRMPPNTVKVDRTTRFGNPFPIGEEGPLGRVAPDAEGAEGFFRQMLRDPEVRTVAGYPSDEEIRAALAGRNLGCWCTGTFCHVRPLLEVANPPTPSLDNRDQDDRRKEGE